MGTTAQSDELTTATAASRGEAARAQAAATGAARIPVAIIANAPAPYRLALHRRLIAGLPELHITSVFTHDFPLKEQPWDLGAAEDINPMRFGIGEGCLAASSPKSFGHEWAKGGRMIAWMKQAGVKAVFLCGYNDAARLRIMRWCRSNGIALFLVADSNIHGERATGVKRVMKNVLLPRILKMCDGYLPCGSSGAAYFKKYGATDDRIYHLPYEPDYDVIHGVTAEMKKAVAEKYKLTNPNARRMVFVGRMVEVKRPDLLVDAFIAMADARPEWELLMIGDGHLREPLAAKVPERLRSRVTWTGFVGNASEVATLYHLSDAFVLPSEYEPWGVVVNEAAAVPLAMCVSHVVGAAPELVKDGRNGRVFKSGDLNALRAALEDITRAENIDAYKRGSLDVMAEWKREMDPIASMRRALRDAGVK